MGTNPERADTTGLEKASDFIDALAEIDPGMQISMARVLLFVARNQDQEGGLTTGAFKRALSMTNSSASRNVYYKVDDA